MGALASKRSTTADLSVTPSTSVRKRAKVGEATDSREIAADSERTAAEVQSTRASSPRLRANTPPAATLGGVQAMSENSSMRARSFQPSGLAGATWSVRSLVSTTRSSPTSARKPSPGWRERQRIWPVAASTQASAARPLIPKR